MEEGRKDAATNVACKDLRKKRPVARATPGKRAIGGRHRSLGGGMKP